MIRLNKTKWKIIKELSIENKTPTELTKKLKITLPSLHIQLKELEKEDLIKKVDEIKGKTRPFTKYSIDKGFIYLVKALPNETEQKFLECDENITFHLRIWSIPQKKYHYLIEKFWWEIQKHIKNIDALILFGSVAIGDAREGSDIDLLILAKTDIEKYQEMFGAFIIGQKEKEEIIMAKVFTAEDFENSLKRGSKFAEEVIKKHIILYDPNKKFKKIKDEFSRKTS